MSVATIKRPLDLMLAIGCACTCMVVSTPTSLLLVQHEREQALVGRTVGCGRWKVDRSVGGVVAESLRDGKSCGDPPTHAQNSPDSVRVCQKSLYSMLFEVDKIPVGVPMRGLELEDPTFPAAVGARVQPRDNIGPDHSRTTSGGDRDAASPKVLHAMKCTGSRREISRYTDSSPLPLGYYCFELEMSPPVAASRKRNRNLLDDVPRIISLRSLEIS